MSALKAAISWNGSNVVLSLFVAWPTVERRRIVPPPTLTQPARVRTYDLEDEGEILPGRSMSEIDLIFDDVPKDLDELVEEWLTSSIRSGARVAWFGFEDSFDFEHILVSDVADQIYGVAAAGFVVVATDDQRRTSDSWCDDLALARRALLE